FRGWGLAVPPRSMQITLDDGTAYSYSSASMLYHEFPGETKLGEAVTRPWIDEAKARYGAVTRDYEQTPWARRAEFELKQGYHFEIQPKFEVLHEPIPSGPITTSPPPPRI